MMPFGLCTATHTHTDTLKHTNYMLMVFLLTAMQLLEA